MRTLKWNAFLSGLCACALVVGIAGSARADVTVEKGSSVVTFPYIEWNNDVHTMIQLTNTGNNMLHVACYYVRTEDGGRAVWEETDFDIWLTKQQPTVWPVGHGRQYNYYPDDPYPGFDVSVPPMGHFIGELKCFEISPTGEPLTGNHLKGEATIIKCDRPPYGGAGTSKENGGWCEAAHDVAKYNAIGVEGIPDAQGTNPLQLDGETYAACPGQLIMNFIADLSVTEMGNLDDAGYTDNSTVQAKSLSFLTLVPCSEDFENQKPTESTVQFAVYNEYEQRFSASTTVDCWFESQLSLIDSPTAPQNSVFSTFVLGSGVGTAWITPVGGEDGIQPVIGVLTQKALTLSPSVDPDTIPAPKQDVVGESCAMTNLHTTGNLPAQITLTAH